MRLLAGLNPDECIIPRPNIPCHPFIRPDLDKSKRYHAFLEQVRNKRFELMREMANRFSYKELALQTIERYKCFLELSNRIIRDLPDDVFRMFRSVAASLEFNENLEFKLDDEVFLRRYNKEMKKVVDRLAYMIQQATQNDSSAVDSSRRSCRCAIL